MLIFFFKQKTAYDIRISDWSSDVCSSDLPLLTRKLTSYSLGLYGSRQYLEESGWTSGRESLAAHRIIGYIPDQIYAPELDYLAELQPGLDANLRSSSINRSEEHTSELQSLMRISYAVFCLKKKKKKNRHKSN